MKTKVAVQPDDIDCVRQKFGVRNGAHAIVLDL
jgi:hypothetical protein